MGFEKINASLASALEGFGGIAAAPASPGGLAVGAAGSPVPLRFAPLSEISVMDGTPALRVFVRCDPQNVFARSATLRVHQQSGAVRTAEATADEIMRLSDDPSVHGIAAATLLHPLMDVATPHTGVPAFRNASGFRGQGVVIGIVDSGIDATHPAFAGRIHSIWDQTIAGAGWGTTNYGTVLKGANLGVSSDVNGHGTHVAGIAAGDHTIYAGIAPQAILVVVKTDFQSTSIADGIRYVFAVADQLGCPAVVNLSLGGHADAHDGSDDLSAAVDQESAAGRIVVAAAGNEGGTGLHSELGVAAGSTGVFPVGVQPGWSGQSPPWVVLNCWYDGAQPCEVQIRTSTGATTPWQGVLAGGSPTRTYSLLGGVIRVTTSPAAANPNGDHQAWIELLPPAGSSYVQGGTWELRLRNPGVTGVRAHAWALVHPDFPAPTFDPSVMRQSSLVGSPGAASEAITVAAYTTRNQWTDAVGAVRTVGLALNDIADFSSPGPRRDGAEKPDVAAPGAMIISCLSSASSPPPTNRVAAGFRVNAGTSMAAPFITGLVALALERNPVLDPGAVRSLLQASCTIPGHGMGSRFEPKWGYGLIDATAL